MTRTHALLAVVTAVFVVSAPAAAMGTPATAGTQAAEKQTNESDELAPGVGTNGTVNTTALYEAHKEVLLDEGYRASENLTVLLNGSEFLTLGAETTGSPDNENVSAEANLTIVGLSSDISLWANDSQKFVRIEKDGNVTYKVVQRGPPDFAGPPNDTGPDHRNGPPMDGGHGMGDGPRGPPMNAGPHMNDGTQMGDGMGMHHGMHMMGPGEMPVPGYAVLFLDKVAGNFTVQNETTVDDRTAHTLTAPVEVDENASGNYTGTISLVVDERGVVHSANVTVDARLYDAETSYSFELAELGVDSVDEPAWLDDVPENATQYGPPDERPGNGPPNGGQYPE